MRRTVGEQHPQPVTGHEPPVCVQPALRRGVEVEGLNELVAVQIVGDQSRHMLDQVGKLECPVTASRVLEVDQPDPDPVPQEVARLPSACRHRVEVSSERRVQRRPVQPPGASRHACWTTRVRQDGRQLAVARPYLPDRVGRAPDAKRCSRKRSGGDAAVQEPNGRSYRLRRRATSRLGSQRHPSKAGHDDLRWLTC